MDAVVINVSREEEKRTVEKKRRKKKCWLHNLFYVEDVRLNWIMWRGFLSFQFLGSTFVRCIIHRIRISYAQTSSTHDNIGRPALIALANKKYSRNIDPLNTFDRQTKKNPSIQLICAMSTNWENTFVNSDLEISFFLLTLFLHFFLILRHFQRLLWRKKNLSVRPIEPSIEKEASAVFFWSKCGRGYQIFHLRIIFITSLFWVNFTCFCCCCWAIFELYFLFISLSSPHISAMHISTPRCDNYKRRTIRLHISKWLTNDMEIKS